MFGVVLAACSTASTPDDAAPRTEADVTAAADATETAAGETAPADTEPAPDTTPVTNDVLLAYAEDVEAYWVAHAGDVGLDSYEPVGPLRTLRLPGSGQLCDGDTIDPNDVEENAVAFNCEEGPLVVWDTKYLHEFGARFGPAAPALMLAHEFGHVIAYRTDIELDNVYHEQFADCMAGAWVADALDRSFAPFDRPGALDDAVAAALEISDRPGDSPDDEEAHGLGFDRIRAFQEGFESGGPRCMSYETDPPFLTESPFETDDPDDGNAAFEDIRRYTEGSLVEFGAAHRAIGTLEPTLATLSESDLRTAHDDIGDGATMSVIALDTLTGGASPEDDATLLRTTCHLGAWLGWVVDQNSESLALSPGDVDEAVMAISRLTPPSAPGLLFDQVDFMRIGFIDGLDACPTT